jgi:hypothetical protein
VPPASLASSSFTAVAFALTGCRDPSIKRAEAAVKAQPSWSALRNYIPRSKRSSIDMLTIAGRTRAWIIIEEDQIGDLEKAMRVIKKCKAFQKCLGDRHAGKVKRCYLTTSDGNWMRNEMEASLTAAQYRAARLPRAHPPSLYFFSSGQRAPQLSWR